MNTDLLILQFVYDYQKLCCGRTPSTRLISKGIGETVKLSHQSVFTALERLEKEAYLVREPFTAPTKVRDIVIQPDGEIALRLNKPREPAVGEVLLDEPDSLGD